MSVGVYPLLRPQQNRPDSQPSALRPSGLLTTMLRLNALSSSSIANRSELRSVHTAARKFAVSIAFATPVSDTSANCCTLRKHTCSDPRSARLASTSGYLAANSVQSLISGGLLKGWNPHGMSFQACNASSTFSHSTHACTAAERPLWGAKPGKQCVSTARISQSRPKTCQSSFCQGQEWRDRAVALVHEQRQHSWRGMNKPHAWNSKTKSTLASSAMSRALQIKVANIPGKKLEHQGIRVQLLGQIELKSERGAPIEFLSLGTFSPCC